jgi:hypothetical protein
VCRLVADVAGVIDVAPQAHVEQHRRDRQRGQALIGEKAGFDGSIARQWCPPGVTRCLARLERRGLGKRVQALGRRFYLGQEKTPVWRGFESGGQGRS